jgi:hypothetical protein
METVTLKGEDFKVLHNTLWELGNIDDDRVQALVERIRTVALKDAYEQDTATFDSKMDYYGEFQRQNGLAAIWSVYDLPPHGFLSDHPFPSDAFVVYQGHHVPVYGQTWGDVYRAADRAIELSGDGHHIFIEHFEQVGNELRLTTGS